MRIRIRVVVLALSLLALTGCSIGQKFKDYRYQSPSEYYFYTPENYDGEKALPLFIGLHGKDEKGEDCFANWLSNTEEFNFFLLCPTLPESDGAIDVLEGERILSAVLLEVMNHYKIEDRFFIAGYLEGADFALAYSFRYPQAFRAVSLISVEDFPEINDQVGGLPFLITVGELDQARVEKAQSFVAQAQASALLVRLIILEGEDHRFSSGAARLTIDFFEEISR